MKKKFTTIAIIGFFVFPLISNAQINYPKPTGFVNDFADILTTDQELEQTLRLFEAETSNQITVITVSSLQEIPIEDYAVELFKEWEIGQAKKDNGILLLVAPNERQVRIEVGYGLEGAVPDILAGEIIRNDITPHFKNNDFDAGVLTGVTSIMKAAQGEYEGSGNVRTDGLSQTVKNNKALFNFIFWVIIIGIAIILNRGKKGRKNGFLWFLLGMLLGGGPGGRNKGGGFGGFGGGSSGGGGASGKW